VSVIELRLEALGLHLPPPKPPVGNYLGSKRSGTLLFVSGRVSRLRGEVGSEVDLAAARTAARDTVLDLLAIVKQDLGDLDRIVAVERVHGFVRSAPAFTEHSRRSSTGLRTCSWRSGVSPGGTPARPRGRRNSRSAPPSSSI
jgi:enamine deaminase RidA (YjgF/YER057c/UK114 family)